MWSERNGICLHCANFGHFNTLSNTEIQAKLRHNLYLGTRFCANYCCGRSKKVLIVHMYYTFRCNAWWVHFYAHVASSKSLHVAKISYLVCIVIHQTIFRIRYLQLVAHNFWHWKILVVAKQNFSVELVKFLSPIYVQDSTNGPGNSKQNWGLEM